MSAPASHVVVLGSGFVGHAVAGALAGHATTSVLDLPTHPELATRGAAGRALLIQEIERTGAAAVVNSCGRLRGTDEEMLDANHAWPAWLVEALDGTGVRFVHIGSASEYGDPGSAEPVAETSPARPRGLYGETKWAGSRAVLDARAAGLDAVVARGFNLVAARVPDVSPLHQMRADVTALPCDGGDVELWWPATVRDFVLLDDLAEAIARLALAPRVPDIVNVCSGVGVSFEQIVRALAAQQGKEVQIRSLDRPGIAAVVGDPGRLRACTGLTPRMSPALLASVLLSLDVEPAGSAPAVAVP